MRVIYVKTLCIKLLRQNHPSLPTTEFTLFLVNIFYKTLELLFNLKSSFCGFPSLFHYLYLHILHARVCVGRSANIPSSTLMWCSFRVQCSLHSEKVRKFLHLYVSFVFLYWNLKKTRWYVFDGNISSTLLKGYLFIFSFCETYHIV